jgi:hypothetical protein
VCVCVRECFFSNLPVHTTVCTVVLSSRWWWWLPVKKRPRFLRAHEHMYYSFGKGLFSTLVRKPTITRPSKPYGICHCLRFSLQLPATCFPETTGPRLPPSVLVSMIEALYKPGLTCNTEQSQSSLTAPHPTPPHCCIARAGRQADDECGRGHREPL